MKKILFSIIFVSALLAKTAFSQVPSGGIISGPDKGCTDVLGSYVVTGVTGATEYIWTITGVDPSLVGIISPTERSIIFESANITVSVIPKNAQGSGSPITFTTTINSLPAKPTVTQLGDVLTATAGVESYQWYFNGNRIENATARSYTITATGLYEVEVKNAAGCSIKSEKLNRFTTSVKEDAQFKSFKVYPNPVTASKITTSFSDKYDMQFFTLSGEKVIDKTSLKGEVETDLSGVNPGVYLMRVTSNGKIANRKIIVK